MILCWQVVNLEVSETVFTHLDLRIARNLAAARIEPEDGDPDPRQEAGGVTAASASLRMPPIDSPR